MFTIDARKKTASVVQGDTMVFALSANNHDFVTGDVVHFTVKNKASDSTALISKTFSTFVDGKAVISLSKTDTNIAVGNHKFDIQCNLSDGTVDTVLIGTFNVTEGVTAE